MVEKIKILNPDQNGMMHLGLPQKTFGLQTKKLIGRIIKGARRFKRVGKDYIIENSAGKTIATWHHPMLKATWGKGLLVIWDKKDYIPQAEDGMQINEEETEVNFDDYESVKPYYALAKKAAKKGIITNLSEVEEPDEEGIIGEQFSFSYPSKETDVKIWYDPGYEEITIMVDGNDEDIDIHTFEEYLKTNKMAKGGITGSSKFRTVMKEFKSGDLHHGTSGNVVVDKDVALAIAYSEARKVQPGYGMYAKGGSTVRANNSPLIKYANFEDKSHINLLRLSTTTRSGKLYRNKNKYAVSVNSIKDGQNIIEFKTLGQVESKFNELVKEKKTHVNTIKESKTMNYGNGGSTEDFKTIWELIDRDNAKGKTFDIADDFDLGKTDGVEYEIWKHKASGREFFVPIEREEDSESGESEITRWYEDSYELFGNGGSTSKKLSEDQLWDIIEKANWDNDGDSDRTQIYFQKLPEEKFHQVEKFARNKREQLYKKYKSAWLGNPGINASDDGWDDLTSEVVRRGKKFFNNISVSKLRQMADNNDYRENFFYSFQNNKYKNGGELEKVENGRIYAKGGEITKEEVVVEALKMGVDFNKDVHNQNFGPELNKLAKRFGYRKSRTSSGSLGRSFFAYLEKEYDKSPTYYDELVKGYAQGGETGAIGGKLRSACSHEGKITEEEFKKIIGEENPSRIKPVYIGGSRYEKCLFTPHYKLMN